jgi:predicted AAA+ superfamily ATPase
VTKIPIAQRVVIVGNKLSPGQPEKKKDGTVVHTLWGELAWQLGGKEGYAIIKKADETATNPGDKLRELFNQYSPCLTLIDEWVAYARQLHDNGDLPGGTFETHFTFAQTLSEAAKAAKNTLFVVSIPASESGQVSPHGSEAEDVEVGGERGRAALSRLKNAIGRVESSWRPASAEEASWAAVTEIRWLKRKIADWEGAWDSIIIEIVDDHGVWDGHDVPDGGKITINCTDDELRETLARLRPSAEVTT